MIRGTTPDFILTVHKADLTGTTVFVTFTQDRFKLTLTNSDFTVVGGESSTIAIRLTQEQTLGLRVGKADVQVRFIDENGVARATKIAQVNIDRVLLERVIEYA